ncbi:MAG: molybdopterin-dependent oxidoreductase [Proteobacteria bacterium]|nr:molybdopterin-dependent oxidoreductase [Pseudomonadota bacterium]MBU1709312.1 molybdopterin-dependent oxidoreductase [Pseudomonadota bacterium]
MDWKTTRRSLLKSTGLAAASYPFSAYAGQRDFAEAKTAASAGAKTREIPSICAMCQVNCRIAGVIWDGKLIHVRGNGKGDYNRDKICARGHAAPQLLYDPDRLKYPLRREGRRGEGKWTRISWGEAIDTISFKLEQTINRHGPESLALFANGPSSTYMRELFNTLEVPNINNSVDEFCTSNRDLAYGLTFGNTPLPLEITGLDNIRCMVLFGSHLGENVNVPELNLVIDALAKGMKLIVIDPRFSSIASKADYHLMIKPGTDTALIFGWINHIVETGLYDIGHVSANVAGFSALREHVSGFTVQRVSRITGLPVEIIKETATLLAQSSRDSYIHPGKHSTWYGSDVQRLRARAILTGLLGAWKNHRNGLSADTQDFMPWSAAEDKAHPGKRKNQPASEIIKGVLSDRIKGLGFWGQNPVHGYPHLHRTVSALNKADFIFSCDILPSEITLYSDIILPEATFMERTDIIESWISGNTVTKGIRFPLVAPLHEAKDPYWIVKQLSIRLGRGTGFRFGDIKQRIDDELKVYGTSYDRLLKNGGTIRLPRDDSGQVNNAPIRQEMVGTSLRKETFSEDIVENPLVPQVGRIELYSKSLQDQGFHPLPVFEAPEPPPEGFARLLYGRMPVHTLSSTQNNTWLNREISDNELWVNDVSAKGMGLVDGEQLYLENQDGVCSPRPIRIKTTPGIHKECVFMAHGFGGMSPAQKQGFNRGVSDNFLISRSSRDKISGNRGMRVNFVRLVRDDMPIDMPA